MPYVNIPDSGLGGSIAKIVGKLQGQVSAQIVKQATSITNKLNREGCPTTNELQRLRKQKQQLDTSLTQINNRLGKFKALPKKLKSPLNGFKAALKIILTLPIPQSVPPGFGLPINITTKYADIMHLLKEFIKQIDEMIQSIEVVLDTPLSVLDGLKSKLNSADNALKVCELGAALDREVENGNIDIQKLIDSGLYDSAGNFSLSNLNRDFDNNRKDRGKWLSGVTYTKDQTVRYNNLIWICTKTHISDINGGKETGPPGKGPWELFDDRRTAASNSLLDSLQKLNDSDISNEAKNRLRELLNTFETPEKKNTNDDSKFFYTGPDGEVYVLEILNDPNSPAIAPRRFAIASTQGGIVKFKGPKSFSSSVDVLLDEIKFRIDNQLP